MSSTAGSQKPSILRPFVKRQLIRPPRHERVTAFPCRLDPSEQQVEFARLSHGTDLAVPLLHAERVIQHRDHEEVEGYVGPDEPEVAPSQRPGYAAGTEVLVGDGQLAVRAVACGGGVG